MRKLFYVIVNEFIFKSVSKQIYLEKPQHMQLQVAKSMVYSLFRQQNMLYCDNVFCMALHK